MHYKQGELLQDWLRITTKQPLSPLMPSSVAVNLAMTVCMLAASINLFLPALDWAWHQVARPERQYHIVVCVLVVALCSYRLIRDKHRVSFAQPNIYATAVVVIACSMYLLNQTYLRLNALSVALFLLFCFGLLGHFISSNAWRLCTLPLLLAMLVLPFEGYLDIFLGFPMRLLGAEVAASVLQLLGIASISSDTVLLIDNQAAIVDVDCSGIKGFWIGAIFICAITWIEQYRIDKRWAAIIVVAAMMLFAGNVFRIIVLVWLDLVINKAQWAQVLHESLGLLSFLIAVMISWQLLRLFAHQHENQQTATPQHSSQPTNATRHDMSINKISLTTLFLASTIIACNLILIAKTVAPSKHSFSSFEIADKRFLKQTLNPIEQQFFNHNNASAHKYIGSIEFEGSVHMASVLVVLSAHWKAQHKPEHCYIAQGFSINASHTLAFDGGAKQGSIQYRQLILSKRTATTSSTYTSDYWFQSGNTTTVNYSRRVLSQIQHPDKPWAMVSVLWHEGVPAQARQQLLADIQKSVTRNLYSNG